LRFAGRSLGDAGDEAAFADELTDDCAGVTRLATVAGAEAVARLRVGATDGCVLYDGIT